MADDPKPASDDGENATEPEAGIPQAEPLADGTEPTILKTGETPEPTSQGKPEANRLAGVYRRADIVTTGITFLIAIIVSLFILGAYTYLNRPKKAAAPPKLTTLSGDDLKKLGAFLSGNGSGEPSEILTVNSSSLFNNRVAVNSDLKVTGAVSVSGPASLANLIVDGTATLGVTSIRGQLILQGPLTVQSPAVFSGGATITGNLTTSGNGTFTGTLGANTINVTTLSVNGALSIGGHITLTSGTKPTSSAGTISGTDEAGIITGLTTAGATVTFHASYSKTPIILLTPTAHCPNPGQFYVTSIGGSGFSITNPSACPTFNYFVVQ